MKDYFTISEFAKLRGININSLRYYEKLGLLKPAYTDKTNGYRYYSVEQVSLLNNIILCIQLGIPLKEMVEFLDEDGNLQSQKLLEKGRIIAQQRIQEMQNNLEYIEHSLKNIESDKEYFKRSGVYERYIEERKVIVTDYHKNFYDSKKVLSDVSKIYKEAQKKGLYPILPAGQILEIDAKKGVRCRCFLEVLNWKDAENVITIPAGNYSCMQTKLDPTVNLLQLLEENWEMEENMTFVIGNVMLETYSLENKHSELQKRR